MGMHEGAVVSMATGYALAIGQAQLVNVHTAPGLGNSMNALANARDLHVPLGVVVGQQDRGQRTRVPYSRARRPPRCHSAAGGGLRGFRSRRLEGRLLRQVGTAPATIIAAAKRKPPGHRLAPAASSPDPLTAWP
jgi:hypothetical protein